MLFYIKNKFKYYLNIVLFMMWILFFLYFLFLFETYINEYHYDDTMSFYFYSNLKLYLNNKDS